MSLYNEQYIVRSEIESREYPPIMTKKRETNLKSIGLYVFNMAYSALVQDYDLPTRHRYTIEAHFEDSQE